MEYIYKNVSKVGAYTTVNKDGYFWCEMEGWGREIEISVISRSRSTVFREILIPSHPQPLIFRCIRPIYRYCKES